MLYVTLCTTLRVGHVPHVPGSVRRYSEGEGPILGGLKGQPESEREGKGDLEGEMRQKRGERCVWGALFCQQVDCQSYCRHVWEERVVCERYAYVAHNKASLNK
jgi:hypothetical protein